MRLAVGKTLLSAIPKYRGFVVWVSLGAALVLFEKCCFAIAGALLDSSVGTIHLILAERLLP